MKKYPEKNHPEKIHQHLVAAIVEIVQEIFTQGVYADKAIEKKFKKSRQWGSRDRRFVAENVYDMVRWWRLLWALLGYSEPPDSREQSDIRRVWGALHVWQHKELPDWYSETINLQDPAHFSRAVLQSIPDWLDEFGSSQLGERWPSILNSLNLPADVFLRVNTQKTSFEELRAKLQVENIEVESVPGVPSALKLKKRKNVFTTEAFQSGLFEVQDAASQMIAPMLQVEPGHRVIDACAGAGGKTLHLAQLMQNRGKLIAMDVHEWKLNELKHRARRNSVDIIETRVIDSNKVIKRLQESCDRLLLDVPCSGAGVLRRNPDGKWKLSLEEIRRLENLQKEILKNYSQMVKAKGMMVYSTCSVFPQENSHQIQWFLDSHPSWTLIEEKKIFPDDLGFDGFYSALLRKD